MIYLSGAVRAEVARLGMGYMLQSNMGNRPALAGVPWAVDTGCYSRGGSAGFQIERYFTYLDAFEAYRETCLFATAPDVWGDGIATWYRSLDVLPAIRRRGYRAAVVIQPGIEQVLDWSAVDAVFSGGPNDWRASDAHHALVREARARGLWTHMGRVNSRRRLLAARAQGFHSADGTYIAFGPDRNAPKAAAWVREAQAQGVLL